MRTPTSFERDLGKHIRETLGGETKVIRFSDDEGAHDVFIVSATDCPAEGVSSYASVGLSNLMQPAGNNDVMVEVVAVGYADTPHLDNLVASCVFDCLKNSTAIVYGACIADIVVQYGISNTLRHVTFVAPFLWEGLGKLEVGKHTVRCLLMLPISDAERDFLEQHGIDALEDLFEKHQIDIYDINRFSIL